MATKIEWTEQTWNPFVGCSIVSPGCHNCYAMRMAARLEAMGQKKYAGTTKNGRWTGKVNVDEDAWAIPLRRKKPTVYFVNSMSDVFHENVPDEWIDRLFAVMALCQRHTFQVLTKRAERMARYWTDGYRNGRGEHTSMYVYREAMKIAESQGWNEMDRDAIDCLVNNWPVNCWAGVSVENQKYADERIPHLLKTPATIRFLSCEPLLGDVNLISPGYLADCPETAEYNLAHYGASQPMSWIICGGESGAGARPMHPDWARSLRDQCQAARVAFFFKQWGEWLRLDDEARNIIGDDDPRISDSRRRQGGTKAQLQLIGKETFVRVGKKAAGRMLDEMTWDEFPSKEHSNGQSQD